MSLYTDEDAVESDDSLAKEWTAIREDAGEKRRDDEASSAAETPRNDAGANEVAKTTTAAADPAEDSDIDEDWGMESE